VAHPFRPRTGCGFLVVTSALFWSRSAAATEWPATAMAAGCLNLWLLYGHSNRPVFPAAILRCFVDSACPARSGRCKEIPFFSILYRVPMRADPSYRQRVTTAHPVPSSLPCAFRIPLLSASSASLRFAIYVLSPPMLTNSRAFPKNDVLCFHEITLSRGRGYPHRYGPGASLTLWAGRFPDTFESMTRACRTGACREAGFLFGLPQPHAGSPCPRG